MIAAMRGVDSVNIMNNKLSYKRAFLSHSYVISHIYIRDMKGNTGMPLYVKFKPIRKHAKSALAKNATHTVVVKTIS